MTVNWDSAVPLEAAGYHQVPDVHERGRIDNVWRSNTSFGPSNQATPGSRPTSAHYLMPSFPKGIPWANNGRIDMVPPRRQWFSGLRRAQDHFEWPMTVEIDRAIGGFRMAEPARCAALVG